MMLHCTLLWSLEIPLILKLTVTLGCHLRNDSTLYRFGHAIGTNLSDGYVFFPLVCPSFGHLIYLYRLLVLPGMFFVCLSKRTGHYSIFSPRLGSHSLTEYFLNYSNLHGSAPRSYHLPPLGMCQTPGLSSTP
jgi:hypothetical protein